MSKKEQIYKKYSPEFKLCVIIDMRENRLGYRETARKYDLVWQSETSAATMIHRWERIYLEEGSDLKANIVKTISIIRTRAK